MANYRVNVYEMYVESKVLAVLLWSMNIFATVVLSLIIHCKSTSIFMLLLEMIH